MMLPLPSFAAKAGEAWNAGSRPSWFHVVLYSVSILTIASALVSVRAGNSRAPADDGGRAPIANVEAKAVALTAALSSECPSASPVVSQATESCRRALLASPVIQASLAPSALWSRQATDRRDRPPSADLSRVTAYTLVSTYLPLFAFESRFVAGWSARQKMWSIEVGAHLREHGASNAEPLRSEDELWVGFEHTEALVLWLEPGARFIQAAQAVKRPGSPSIVRPPSAPIAAR